MRFLIALTIALLAAPAFAETVAIPKSVVEAAGEKVECDDLDPKDSYEGEPLSGGLLLVTVRCWRAAYQSGHIIFAVYPKEPAKPRLLEFTAHGGRNNKLEKTFMVTDPDYAPKTKTLESFHKGRGVGDCGMVSTWKWTGKDFKLTRVLFKDECDAQPFLDGPTRRWQVYPRKQ